MAESVEGTGGIVNIGFTCYANSVIQALRHFNSFVDLLQEDKYTTILKKNCKYNDFTKQFANIIQTLSKITKNSSIRPMGFWSEFDTVSQNTGFDHLSSREPHDSHEFLMFILDALHESLSRHVNMTITKVNLLTEKQKLQQKSLELWISQFHKSYSPLVNMIFGIHHIKVICNKCNNISNNFETFNTLNASFNDNKEPTLIECLLNDMADEILDGYQCDNCKEKTQAKKERRIWKLPKNLIIVFKRFTYDGRKIQTPIQSFTEEIDLKNIYSKISPHNNQTDYKLVSIVDHHGSINGGHYTAQGYNSKEKKWFLYDDQNVHSLENHHIGQSTYILFLNSK
jgi:ubiquitin carboxyl-terminal hydrolase 8